MLRSKKAAAEFRLCSSSYRNVSGMIGGDPGTVKLRLGKEKESEFEARIGEKKADLWID